MASQYNRSLNQTMVQCILLTPRTDHYTIILTSKQTHTTLIIQTPQRTLVQTMHQTTTPSSAVQTLHLHTKITSDYNSYNRLPNFSLSSKLISTNHTQTPQPDPETHPEKIIFIAVYSNRIRGKDDFLIYQII